MRGVVRIQIQIQIHTSLQEELWFEGVESVEFGSSEERGWCLDERLVWMVFKVKVQVQVQVLLLWSVYM